MISELSENDRYMVATDCLLNQSGPHRSPSPSYSSCSSEILFGDSTPSFPSVSSTSLPLSLSCMSPGSLEDIDDLIENGFDHELAIYGSDRGWNVRSSPLVLQPLTPPLPQLRIVSPLNTPNGLDLLAPIENFDNFDIPEPQLEVEIPNDQELSDTSENNSVSSISPAELSDDSSCQSSLINDFLPSGFAYGESYQRCHNFTEISSSLQPGDENVSLFDLKRRIESIPARGALIQIGCIRYVFRDHEGNFRAMFNYRTNNYLFQALGFNNESYIDACRVSLSQLYQMIRDRPEILADIRTCRENAIRESQDNSFLPIQTTITVSKNFETVANESPKPWERTANSVLNVPIHESECSQIQQSKPNDEGSSMADSCVDSYADTVEFVELKPARVPELSISATNESSSMNYPLTVSNLKLLADAALSDPWHCLPAAPSATLVSSADKTTQ